MGQLSVSARISLFVVAVALVATATLFPAIPARGQSGDAHRGKTVTSQKALNKPIYTTNSKVIATVTLGAVTMGNTAMPAWTYVSQGLVSLGQPEVVITVLKKSQEADNDFPEGPLSFINTLAEGKITGAKTLTAGSYARVPAFLENFPGILLIAAEPVGKLEVPAGSLAAVGITAEELAVCDLAGSSRTMGHLSQQAVYYPCPYWSKRGRRSTFSEAEVAQIKKDPFTTGAVSFGSDSSAMLKYKLCTLLLTPETGVKLSEALKKSKSKRVSLRMALQPDPRAKSFLVWQTEKDPVRKLAVGRPSGQDGSLSAQYLLIAPDQPEDRLDIVYDGFVLFLTNASYDKMIRSLTSLPVNIPLAAGDAVQFSTLWNLSSQPTKSK